MFETACKTDGEVIAKMLFESNCFPEKVGIESGCISFWLIDELKKLKVNAICIESKQMATIIALKVNKTDQNDARLIADAMRSNLYKGVYHKTKESIDIGLQMRARRTLIDVRTKLKNSMRGFLKAYGIRFGVISHQKFPEAVRQSIVGCEEKVKLTKEFISAQYVV